MPRDWSANLQEIHKAYQRRDTLVLYLADNTTKFLARGAVTRGLTAYENVIASVDSLRQTIDAGVDRLTVTCQNVDSLLGFNVASNLRLLDYALAEYGRIYQSVRNPVLKEDVPQIFRSVLANAEVSETRIRFEIIADYESLGSIVAARALSPRCWAVFKNGVECTSTANTTTCPKTRSACIKRGKEWEFLGWEFFEEPASNLPGTGGNEGGTGTGTLPCFLGETRIATPNRDWTFKEIKDRFDLGLRSILSFNPTTGEVEKDEIEEIFTHRVTGYFTLEFDHGYVNVTPEHPFLTDWDVFKPADGFTRLDTTKIYSRDGRGWHDSRLRAIKWNSDVDEIVYNCRVKKNRTYFANDCGVHNSKQIEVQV